MKIRRNPAPGFNTLVPNCFHQGGCQLSPVKPLLHELEFNIEYILGDILFVKIQLGVLIVIVMQAWQL